MGVQKEIQGTLSPIMERMEETMKRYLSPLAVSLAILAVSVSVAAAYPLTLVKQDPGEGCWQSDCWGKLIVEGGELTLVCVDRGCIPASNCTKYHYESDGWDYCQCGFGENIYCAFGTHFDTEREIWTFDCRGQCLDTNLKCCKKNIMGGTAQCCKCVAPTTEGICPNP